MKRRLFTLAAAAVSLLLCLATAGLWGRSYSSPRGFLRSSLQDNSSRLDFVQCQRGGIVWSKQTTSGGWHSKKWSVSYESLQGAGQWPYRIKAFAGFEWASGDMGETR